MEEGRVAAEVAAIFLMFSSAIAAAAIGLHTTFSEIKRPETFDALVQRELTNLFMEYNKRHI